MRKAGIEILAVALMLFIPFTSEAFRPFGRKVKTAPVSGTAKTEYEKFLSRKDMKKGSGIMNIYLDGEDIYLEIPDSLEGRQVSIGSFLKESSVPTMNPGMEVTGDMYSYRITKTDSLVLFKVPSVSYYVPDGDSSIIRSLDNSSADAIAFAFPIRYRSTDNTRFIINATKLFDSSDKKLVDLYAGYFGDDRIMENTRVDELSEVKDVMSFRESVTVIQDATYDVELLSGSESRFSTTLVTTMSLLPENGMPVREADSRIGVRKIRSRSFDSKSGFSDRYLACRWDLRHDRKIRIYVDTLLPATWQAAVKAGIEAWNPAFRKTGLGDVLEVLPFPSDSTFSACDPRLSTVSYSSGSGREINGRLHTDNRTGEILGISMTIPGDYLLGLRYASSYIIGDVDPRYQKYDIPDDAVCEALKAQIMRMAGLCLGLGANYAGSTAYTPAELRNPEFTSAHGITASVMDDVLFNILARPGDKEKGVATVVDRIGAYDYYAIEWLYGDFPGGTLCHGGKHSPDSLIDIHHGMREYIYVPYSQGNPDPRANRYDLGSDPLEAFDAAMSHLHFAAANADKWISYPDVPEEGYRQLYVEWIWLQMLDNVKILSPYVGGLYSRDVRANSACFPERGVPESCNSGSRYLMPVSEELQREAVRRIMSVFLDMDWLNANKRLMALSGVYTTYSGLTYINTIGQGGILQRLPYLARATRLAGNTYTPDKFLSDFQKLVLADVSKGHLEPQEDIMICQYLLRLIDKSSLLKSRYRSAFKAGDSSLVSSDPDCPAFKSGFSDGQSLALPLTGIESDDVEGMDVLAVKYLQNARRVIVSGKSRASDIYTKGKMDFMIYIIDSALGKFTNFKY